MTAALDHFQPLHSGAVFLLEARPLKPARIAMAELTQKQEAFALAYVETGNAAEAYRRAYDVKAATQHSTIYSAASRLLNDSKIYARVLELQEKAAELSLYTVKRAFEEYETARQLAIQEANPSAAVSAVTGKVKLFGLEQPQRTQHEVTGDIQHIISSTPPSAEEWAAEHGADED